MKKRNSKKGFTLVELVIVIAVIAILAGVLIPTFGGVVEKANQSAALQEARNQYTMYLADKADDGDVKDDLVIVVKNDAYYVVVTDGKLDAAAVKVDDTHSIADATKDYKILNSTDNTNTSYNESKIYVK